MNDRLLSPAEPSAADIAYDAFIVSRTEALIAEALRGQGLFWKDSYADEDIVEAVRRAFSGIALTPTERWSIVERATLSAMARYTREVAE